MAREFGPVTGDERAMLLGFLEYYRETVCTKVDGLTDEQARFKPTPASNPLVGIVHHLGWVERGWFGQTFAGVDVGRSRDADEFDPPDIGLAEAVRFFRDSWARSNEIVRGAGSLDETGTTGGGTEVSLRWILLHMIEETARHAGHADLTRELIDGTTGS